MPRGASRTDRRPRESFVRRIDRPRSYRRQSAGSRTAEDRMEAIVNPCISEMARFRLSRRQDFYSELAKMVVKSNRRRDTEIIDHDFACTIGEAPAGTGSLLKQNPCPVDLLY